MCLLTYVCLFSYLIPFPRVIPQLQCVTFDCNLLDNGVLYDNINATPLPLTEYNFRQSIRYGFFSCYELQLMPCKVDMKLMEVRRKELNFLRRRTILFMFTRARTSDGSLTILQRISTGIANSHLMYEIVKFF